MLVPFSPPPGLNSDDTGFLAGEQWADGCNVRFVQGRAQAIGGSQASLNGSFNGVRKMLAYDVNGSVRVATAGSGLYSHILGSANFNITPASGWIVLDATRFCLAMFGNVLLAAISGGKLFESAGGAQATEIVNAPDKITCMVVTPSRQVMALGCNEELSGTFNGRCIRWSDIGDSSSWTSLSSNNAGEYILPGQADIVSGCILGDEVLIWTKTDLWVGRYVGDPTETFAFTRVASGGIVGLDAFAIHRQTAFWISPYLTVHSYQAGLGVADIPCPISRDFLEFCNRAHLAKIHGCALSRFGEVWFYYPDNRDGLTECSRYISFGVNESAAAQRPVWSRGQLIRRAVIDSPLLASELSLYGTTVLSLATNTLITDDDIYGTPWPGWFLQSGEYYVDQGQRRMMIRSFIPDFEILTTAELELYLRDRPTNLPRYRGMYTVTTGAPGKIDLRASGKLISIKLNNYNSGAKMRMGKCLFDVVPLGER
jgi:hypothetical protein